MTPETYVVGSIILSLIVVAILSRSDPIDLSWFDPLDDALRCPRCGATMQDVGSGKGGCHVVPTIVVLTCPQCGYSKRSC